MHTTVERPEAAESPEPPTAEAISLTPKSFVGHTLFTAVWVTGATLAVNAGLAGLLWLAIRDHDPSDGGMAGIGFAVILFWGVPFFYVIFALIGLARSPERRGFATIIGVLIAPAVLIGGLMFYDNARDTRRAEAESVIRSITATEAGTRRIPLRGQVFWPSGHIVDGVQSDFGCGESLVLRSSSTLSGGANDPHALSWIRAGEDILRELDFDVSTSSYESIDARGRVQRIELVLLARRGDDAVLLQAEMHAKGAGHRHVTETESMSDPCVQTLELTDLDSRYTPSPLPDRVEGYSAPVSAE